MADDPRKDSDDDDGDEPSKKPVVEEAEEGDEGPLPEPQDSLVRASHDADEQGAERAEAGDEEEEEEDEEGALPGQMGHRRYVYAAFFVFAICIAYFLSKAGMAIWHRLSQYTPKVGEPREDLMGPIAAAVAGFAMFFTYRRNDVRTLSDEVALELSKVEWPTKEQLRRSTTIVVSACLLSAFGFWLYDITANRAVGFITDSNKTWMVLLRVGGAGVAIWIVRALGIRFLAGTGRA
ncbi:MAG: preprotein translocase subunit SecE [Polyangiales bacterium]